MKELYRDSIVMDGLININHLEDYEPYFQKMIDSGVTAISATMSTSAELGRNFSNAVRYISEVTRIIKANSDKAMIATVASDIETAKKEGKAALILGFQTSAYIEKNINFLDAFHKIGIRWIQLSHNRRTLAAEGCAEKTDGGLSLFGLAVVERMNELGLLIDLSHCSYNTTMQAIEASKTPVAFTHANPKAMCDYYRNKTDEEMKALAEKGGVMGINAISMYSRTREGVEPSIEDYFRMVDYTVNLVGVDHVGIGTDITIWTEEDFNKVIKRQPELVGTFKHLDGLDSISLFPNFCQGLIERGYSKQDIKKILAENWLRLFRETWKS